MSLTSTHKKTKTSHMPNPTKVGKRPKGIFGVHGYMTGGKKGIKKGRSRKGRHSKRHAK